jgi:hypothetical protein
LWALLVLPLIWLLLLVAVSIPAVGHARSYIKVVKSDYSAERAITSADSLNTDITRVFSIINLPVSKQISSLLGLNFSDIKNEITAAVSAGPILAGTDKPKRYLISFQNSAEARGTGGILGAYALIESDKGNLKILQTGSNAALYGISLKEIPVAVPAEFFMERILQFCKTQTYLPTFHMVHKFGWGYGRKNMVSS